VGTPSQPFRIIGRRTPTVEALEKVTGRAPLGGHVPLPCLLMGTVRRSPSAHARLQHIDTGRAAALPGVRAVITGQDRPTVKPGTPEPAGSVFVNEYSLVRLGAGALIFDDMVVRNPFAAAMEGLGLLQPRVLAGVWLLLGPTALDG